MEKYKTVSEFKQLTEKEQWEYVYSVKEYGIITLDNDCTTFRFFDESLDLGYSLESDCGNRSGVDQLLLLLGFNFEHC